MGSSFKKAIFEEHVQVGLVGWAQKVKRKNQLKAAAPNGSAEGSSNNGSSTPGIQLGRIAQKDSVEDIPPTTGAQGGTK